MSLLFNTIALIFCAAMTVVSMLIIGDWHLVGVYSVLTFLFAYQVTKDLKEPDA